MATAARVETRIGWHELVAPEVERAQAFYTRLFGWTLRVWRPGVHDYAMIHVRGADHGGFLRQAGEPRWLLYVEVADVDAVAARMEGAGGRLAAGPVELPGVGRYAVLADPEGAELVAIAVEDQEEAPRGVFCWDELSSGDPAAAAVLYGELFGWEAREVRPGYLVFHRGGERVAGLAAKPPEAPSAAWLSYLCTDDLDAAVRRAERLGAFVTTPPLEVRGRGRFAVLIDPLGAPFGLVERPS